MRTIPLAAALILATATPAPAADEDLGPRAGQAVGAMYSTISGSGFGYIRTYESGWGWHVAGIGWGQGGSAFWNVGGAVTKEIDRRRWGTLYGLFGLGAGVSTFAGDPSGGLSPASTPQFNATPGLGFSWGPVFVEGGMSVFTNGGGIGFGPGFGSGLVWWF